MSSDFFKKMAGKGKQSHAKHKGDEVKYDTNGDLPPMDGVAKLVDIGVRVYKDGQNKGKHYFYAAGIVVSPEYVEHQGNRVKVAGRRTSIIENLFDTPGKARASFDDHWAWVLNELKKLNVDVDSLEFEDIEGALESIKEDGPHFEFRTWVGKPTPQYPNPRTNHVWNGVTADPETGDGQGGDVQDDTPPADADADASGDEQPADEPAADETPADDTPPEPQKGDVWQYQPPGKEYKKPVDCEVEKVYGSKRTADLKLVSDPRKKFPGVSWDKMTVPA